MFNKFTLSLWVCILVTGCSSTKSELGEEVSWLLKDSKNIKFNYLIKDFETISSSKFSGRKTGTRGSNLAQDYIIEQLKQSKIKPLLTQYRHSFSFQKSFSEVSGNNIIGFIPGRECFDKYIVLTAHFDHLGKKGGSFYLGADDNASGVASLLSIARKISINPLRCNTLILFTDAEESGLLGAKAFAKDFPYLMKKTLLNINLDMLAGDKKTKRLHLVYRDINRLLGDKNRQQLQYIYQNLQDPLIIKKGFRQSGNAINKRVNWYNASDHGVFNHANIPFIYYGVGTHQNYHTVRDTFENSNKEFLTLATKAIYQHLLFIDQNVIY